MSYATREQLQICFGRCNVEQWADTDNDCDPAKIDAAISWAIECACEWINGQLRGIIEPIPFEEDCVPKCIKTLACEYAGWLLYSRRICSDEEQRQYSKRYKTHVVDALKEIKSGKKKLECGRRVGNGISVNGLSTYTPRPKNCKKHPQTGCGCGKQSDKGDPYYSK